MELRQVQVRIEKGTNFIMDGVKTTRPAKYTMGKFHCWEDYKYNEYSCIKAIVELEDGTVSRFDAEDVKFINKPLESNDSNGYFLMD
jgi:hypothetical protein